MNNWAGRWRGWAVAVLAMAAACPAFADDLAAMQGVWYGGETDGGANEYTLTIAGDAVTLEGPDETTVGTLTLNPEATPKELDLQVSVYVALGVYLLEEDRLTITVNPIGYPFRPAGLFTATTLIFTREVSGEGRFHSADTNKDYRISETELSRVAGYYNAGGYHDAPGTEDGFALGAGTPHNQVHDADFKPRDWMINALEISRLVSFYNAGGYHVDAAGYDGFAPGVAAG